MQTTDTLSVTRAEALEALEERLVQFSSELAVATAELWLRSAADEPDAWLAALTEELEAEGLVRQTRHNMHAVAVCPPGLPLDVELPGSSMVLHLEG